MIEIRGLNMRVSRGDYFPLRISMTNSTGAPYTLQIGDVVTFAIRGAAPIIEIPESNAGHSYVDMVIPTDLPPKVYKYDISIKFADSKVRTLMWVADYTVERTARA